MLRRLSALTLALLAAGCTVPVAAGLDENDANRIVVALDHASIDATKESDPSGEGKYRILVAKDDVPQALGAMRDEELPRPRPAGVLEAVGKGALVPSQAAEHAQLIAGLAGDLQRTLEGIEGVLSARVHLNVPSPEPFAREATRARATASVLVEHRGATPPVGAESVQRLVAGGVAGLTLADVAVVMVSRAAPPVSGQSPLAHVGPIAVARASMRSLQGALAGLVGLVAVLAAVTLFLYARLRKLREAGHAKGPADTNSGQRP